MEDEGPTSSPTWCPRPCPVCHLQCKSRQVYDNHVEKHVPKKNTELPIACPICKITFKKMKYLTRHNLLNRCGGPVQKESEDTCEKCGSTFATFELLKNHKIFERCGIRASKNAHNRNKASRPKSLNLSLLEDDTVCPVYTCRRSFKSKLRETRNSHILKDHATWDGKCIICEEKFDCHDDIFDHMKEAHGSQENFYEENLVRVKTEEILEDVKIKVELGVDIKQELVPEMELGLVENEICNVKIKKEICVDKIKQEICDVVKVKCEPDQYFLNN